MNKKTFDKFFKPYSKNVDQANTLSFWKLSDQIITEVIKKHIPVTLSSGKTILDAGGGTGRWICDLGKIYKSSFILYDLSRDMLDVAGRNIAKAKMGKRVTIIEGDLAKMDGVADNSVDHIISVYSPLSFIYRKDAALKELYRVLRKGGKILIMGHGYYNALASKINNFGATAKELEVMVKQSMVKWDRHVPGLNLFSQESMAQMLIRTGFRVISSYGVPVFVQPGPEDFDSSNLKRSRVSVLLEDKKIYKKVLDLEMKYNGLPEVANRGMNIFSIAQK